MILCRQKRYFEFLKSVVGIKTILIFKQNLLMLKQILAILITLNFFLSACNNATKKPENGIDKVVVKSDTSYSIKNVDAVSLDGEQDIRTVLCQNWMNVDDAETLAETDDNSSLLLPIRTFDFFGAVAIGESGDEKPVLTNLPRRRRISSYPEERSKDETHLFSRL